MKQPDARNVVLFDLDGTLTNPLLGISRCTIHAMTEMGLEPPRPEDVAAFIGPPIREAFELMGVPASRVEEAVALYRERYAPIGMFENELIDGIPECLEQLGSLDVRLAVATSKVELYASEILEHFGIADHFDVVAGAHFDGTHADKSVIVADCLRRIGPRVGAAMVGDRHHDVSGARDAHISSVGVTWGFGAREELERAGATRIVDSPADLVASLVDVLGVSADAAPGRSG
jgi:phosphoglycolate phosphatase